jgi:hypothetical protein
MTPDLEFEATPESEAVFALERFAGELRRAETDAYDWKWAIIVGHNAIQNLMVAALDSPSRSEIFSERMNKEFVKWWYDHGGAGTPPAPFLAGFMELYRRLAPPFDVFADMDAINHWRNDFIHFAMNTWAVSVRILPDRFLRCLRVVEHCGWNPGRFEWDSEGLKPRAEKAHAQCVEILGRLKAAYAAAGPRRVPASS